MKKYNNKIAKSGNVELIMISGDGDEGAALSWAKEERFPWPTVLDKDRGIDLIKSFKFDTFPTYLLLDKDGNELLRVLGSDGSRKIFEKLEEVAK